jgi:hypothetical protein
VDAQVVVVVVAPVVRDRLAGPEPAKQLDGLVGARAALLDRHLGRHEVGGVLAADTDAEGETAARRAVEIGHLLGDDGGRVEGEQQGGSADGDGRCLLDQTGEPHHRLGRGVGGGEVPADPEGVHPELLEATDLRRVVGGDEPEGGHVLGSSGSRRRGRPPTARVTRSAAVRSISPRDWISAPVIAVFGPSTSNAATTR